MNQRRRSLLGALLLALSSSSLVYSQTASPTKQKRIDEVISVKQVSQRQDQGSGLVEEFSFLIKDFKVDHQTEMNNLNISVSFRYVPTITNPEYPDFRPIAKYVETFLTNYPNEKDYWEIVNKELTAQVLKKYPVLLSITSEITADPTPLDPYVRATRVTRTRRTVKTK
jgi:hypothetical protein